MSDPKPSARRKQIGETAHDVAGDTAAADPQTQEADGAAALGNDISPESARGIAAAEGDETRDGEIERDERVDAHDVAGDTVGASR